MGITDKQKENIELYLLKDYTLKDIADLYGVTYCEVAKYWRWKKTNKPIIKVQFLGKREPYYENENDYCIIKDMLLSKKSLYEFNTLSEDEKTIYMEA